MTNETQADQAARLEAAQIQSASSHWLRVRQMMKGFGQDCPVVPTIPDAKTRRLRAMLTLEEAFEKIEAMGVHVGIDDEKPRSLLWGEHGTMDVIDFKDLKFVAADISGETEEQRLERLVQIADGCADVSVVNTGDMVAFGLSDEPFLQEVDENNLLKIRTASKHPETGKFIKAPNHPLPDLKGVMQRFLPKS